MSVTSSPVLGYLFSDSPFAFLYLAEQHELFPCPSGHE